jgi:cob(I)alamin adenosyltransferase
MSATSRARIGDSVVATGRGDDGTTGLLFGGARIAKDDPRTEAYGSIDEAVAALGLARAELIARGQAGTLPAGLAGLEPIVLRLQRELFIAAAELATGPDAWDRLRDGQTRVDAAMVQGIEDLLAETECRASSSFPARHGRARHSSWRARSSAGPSAGRSPSTRPDRSPETTCYRI